MGLTKKIDAIEISFRILGRLSLTLSSLHVLSLLETFRPVTVQVVRLIIHQVELPVRKRTITRGARETTWMPVTIQSQKTRVDKGFLTAGAFRVVLLSEALHTVGVVVRGLESLFDWTFARGAREMIRMPETVHGD